MAGYIKTRRPFQRGDLTWLLADGEAAADLLSHVASTAIQALLVTLMYSFCVLAIFCSLLQSQTFVYRPEYRFANPSP